MIKSGVLDIGKMQRFSPSVACSASLFGESQKVRTRLGTFSYNDREILVVRAQWLIRLRRRKRSATKVAARGRKGGLARKQRTHFLLFRADSLSGVALWLIFRVNLYCLRIAAVEF